MVSMPFQPGNKLGALPQGERVDIRRITLKVWRIAEAVIADENYPDPQFRQRLIEKIVSRSAPQDMTLSGDVENPVRIILAKEYEEPNGGGVSQGTV